MYVGARVSLWLTRSSGIAGGELHFPVVCCYIIGTMLIFLSVSSRKPLNSVSASVYFSDFLFRQLHHLQIADLFLLF